MTNKILARWIHPTNFKQYIKDSIDLVFLGLIVDIAIKEIWRELKQ